MSEKIQLEDLLELHTLIETKSDRSNDWVKTIVLKIYGEFLEVRHVEEYISSLLMIGDTLECRIVDNDTITVMHAEVYNIKFASGTIILKINSIKQIENKRKHKRYDTFFSAMYNVQNEMCENYCVVSNVSLSGLCIITRNPLNKGNVIEIYMNCNETCCLAAECNVEWSVQSDKNYLCGLSILYMDEETKAFYRDFIKKLQRREHKIKNRLKQANKSAGGE